MDGTKLYRIHFKEKVTGVRIYTDARAINLHDAINKVTDLYEVDTITKAKVRQDWKWVKINQA